MTTGIIRFFNLQKGYGFITPENGGEEVFVYHTKLTEAGLSNLEQGQKLSFDVRLPQKQGERPTAQNLRLIPS